MKIKIISGDAEEFFNVAQHLDSVERMSIEVSESDIDGSYTIEAGKANCGATWDRVIDVEGNWIWDSGSRGCPSHTWEESGDDKYAKLHNWKYYQ